MKYRVQFTTTAENDLRGIAFRIAEQSGDKDTAIRPVRELQDICNGLETIPERGALPKDRVLLSMGYRYLTHKGYLVFYRIGELSACILINAVFNEKVDYMRQMRNSI